jgi:hypothetical protein
LQICISRACTKSPPSPPPPPCAFHQGLLPTSLGVRQVTPVKRNNGSGLSCFMRKGGKRTTEAHFAISWEGMLGECGGAYSPLQTHPPLSLHPNYYAPYTPPSHPTHSDYAKLSRVLFALAGTDSNDLGTSFPYLSSRNRITLLRNYRRFAADWPSLHLPSLLPSPLPRLKPSLDLT